jgi:tetratricopeptide (TPR) repeat protein
MSATLARLLSCRSQFAEELEAYYQALVKCFDSTPWSQHGKQIRASDVAVPVRVLTEPPTAWDGKNKSRTEGVTWDTEWPRVRRAIVLGPLGGGKSFLARKTVVELARTARVHLRRRRLSHDSLAVPFFLKAEEVSDPKRPDELETTLVALASQELGLAPSLRRDAWLGDALRTGRAWVVIDALDEVKKEHLGKLANRLRTLDERFPRSRVLLTCRTGDYTRALVPWREVTEYGLAPFELQDLRQLFERWFKRDGTKSATLLQAVERNYSLGHACRRPLEATLACLAHEEGALSVDLYASVLRNLLKGAWQSDKGVADESHVGDLLRLLEGIARQLSSTRPGVNLIGGEELLEAIKAQSPRPLPRALKQLALSEQLSTDLLAYAPGLLRKELLDSGVLVRAGMSTEGEDQYSFLHRSFLEYLSARKLYKVVVQDCKEGKYQYVLENVYWPLIQRGSERLNTYEMGMVAQDLDALSRFFIERWTRLVEGLSKEAEALVFQQAGLELWHLGRLTEALECLRAAQSLPLLQSEYLYDAAEDARRIAEILVCRAGPGDFDEALRSANASIECVERASSPGASPKHKVEFHFDEVCKFKSPGASRVASEERMRTRAQLGMVLHQMGRFAEAEASFRAAESCRKDGLFPPVLDDVWDYWFCDLLLDMGRHEDVYERLLRWRDLMLRWRDLSAEEDYRPVHLFREGLEHLTWGRQRLLGKCQELRPGSVSAREHEEEAAQHLEQAVRKLGESGQVSYLLYAHLAQAELAMYRVCFDAAEAFLDKARNLAEEFPSLGLHGADCCLGYARLHLVRGEEKPFVTNIERARQVVDAGYERRRAVVNDLEQRWGNR